MNIAAHNHILCPIMIQELCLINMGREIYRTLGAMLGVKMIEKTGKGQTRDLMTEEVRHHHVT